MNYIKPTIVVFGCTGTVGTEVMRALSLKNCFIRGILRHPDRTHPIPINKQQTNISYISSNLKSTSQLKLACFNADTLFLLTGTSPDQVTNEINIINAAQESGIKRIVKLSAPLVGEPVHVETANWHRKIEEHLKTTQIDYCILRPYAFMQNWERNTFTLRRFGKIYGSMDKASRNYIDCRDVADVAVHYLLSDKPLDGQIVSLTGPEAITNQEMAKRFSHITNSKVDYINLAKEKFYQILTKRAKLPQWLAKHIIELDDFSKMIPEPTESTVEKILNRKPRIMNTYLQESRHLFSRKSLWNFWGK